MLIGMKQVNSERYQDLVFRSVTSGFTRQISTLDVHFLGLFRSIFEPKCDQKEISEKESCSPMILHACLAVFPK